jgi:hypothetical protein
MVAIRSRPSCFSLSKVSSSKAINLRTADLPPALPQMLAQSPPPPNGSGPGNGGVRACPGSDGDSRTATTVFGFGQSGKLFGNTFQSHFKSSERARNSATQWR